MKKVLFCCLLLSVTIGVAFAQDQFRVIDTYVRSLDKGAQSLETFTKGTLIQKSSTDLEKVRAVYVWITENIAYDCRKYGTNKPIRIQYRSQRELERKMAELDQQQLRKTLKLRRGICGDYALLFNTMCGYLGIETKTVQGYVKVNFAQIGKLPKGVNHAWNAYKADGQWYLTDVTWGAGYTDPAVTKFTKHYREEFFQMAPADMIKDHFPEDQKWQLLAKPISAKTFGNQPIYHVNYWDLGIEQITPTKGKLGKSSVTISFKSNKDIDLSRVVVLQGGKVIRNAFQQNGKAYSGSIKLPNGSKRVTLGWLKTSKRVEPIVEYKL